MTLIRGLRRAEDRLAHLDIAAGIAGALAVATQELHDKIVDVLSEPPGQDHSVPWLRTGELRESIGSDVDGSTAVIGSSSSVAVDQELGTSTIPPRSFLAATAGGAADETVASIAASLARHLTGR
jgi:hypothetical protein